MFNQAPHAVSNLLCETLPISVGVPKQPQDFFRRRKWGLAPVVRRHLIDVTVDRYGINTERITMGIATFLLACWTANSSF